MDSTIDARIGFMSAGGTRFCPCASDNSTKPNSPACARYSPVRNDTPAVAPSPRVSNVIRPNLSSSGTTSKPSTRPQRSSTMCQSSIMPMVIKNRPSNTSWNGRMSVSTWCLYSVSDTSMPAIKAPSARLSPAISVSQASPRVMSSRLSMNNSSLRRRATRVSHQRITFCPPTSSSVTNTVAFSMATPSA